MKKLMLFIFVLGAIPFYGQEAQVAEENPETFDQWSIELAAGVHKPTRPFSPGYNTSTPSLWNAELGARYMFTEKFGLKLDFGYYNIQEDDEGGDGDLPSLPFSTTYVRTSLQGVLNLGTMVGLRDVTDRFNFLVHGGAGYSRLIANEPVDQEQQDQILNLIAGITPQIRLTDNIALTGDVSVIGNIRQHYTWNGLGDIDTNTGIRGVMYTSSIGITFYLGDNKKHADWYVAENIEDKELDSLRQRLTKLEDDLIDSDQDGVPNYLDREPNTVSGVKVDSKGYAVDKNKNGIPDELESSLDQRYSRIGDMNSTTGSSNNAIKELINDGYVNVYFQFNSAVPETYSLEAINYLIKYMTDNPEAEGEIIGYADEIGEPAYNSALSERRAKRVYEILIAAGIDAGRLTYRGNGEDGSVDKSSAPARQLVRRVTFQLK